jgi:hypothetical protein
VGAEPAHRLFQKRGYLVTILIAAIGVSAAILLSVIGVAVMLWNNSR